MVKAKSARADLESEVFPVPLQEIYEDMLFGARLLRIYDGVHYRGQVRNVEIDGTGERLYLVVYSNGSSRSPHGEHMTANEVRRRRIDTPLNHLTANSAPRDRSISPIASPSQAPANTFEGDNSDPAQFSTDQYSEAYAVHNAKQSASSSSAFLQEFDELQTVDSPSLRRAGSRSTKVSLSYHKSFPTAASQGLLSSKGTGRGRSSRPMTARSFPVSNPTSLLNTPIHTALKKRGRPLKVRSAPGAANQSERFVAIPKAKGLAKVSNKAHS
eukprot:GEMP01043902.1.p1 GENE.GEMP01043902.1~~GEMP01043902.1.p1  ORF type:complete len:271 (+),score=35.11 GEMP01043902.1:54-866(+)